jgi:hypothetical protein
MQTRVAWLGPLYISVFSVPPNTSWGVSRSWSTTVEGKRGGGLALHSSRIGVSAGVLNAGLQERLIPRSKNNPDEFRPLATSADEEWSIDISDWEV